MTILKEIKDFEDIFGQQETKKQLTSALLVNRNVVLVGPPGVGKTTLAKNISKLLPDINSKELNILNLKLFENSKKIKGEERFIRVQGSPDLNVEDLLGDIDPIKALKYGPTSLEAFTPGKIFKANQGVLFFDELNRCPEKLQNALLQVLEEKKATIAGYDIDFPVDFIFIGSMNPEDFAGTEKLSEVLLDRFDIIYMNYPETLDIEKEVIIKKGKKLDNIKFPDSLLTKTLLFVRRLRNHKNLERAPSVRASLGLYERAQSNALLNKRKEANLEDVKEAIISVLSHRIRLKPSIKYLTTPTEFLTKELNEHLEKKQDHKETDKRGDLL
tara:strand:- start:48798 stop:49784 length:987 start_codon:yes stop_codon:yes gene_type:complete